MRERGSARFTASLASIMPSPRLVFCAFDEAVLRLGRLLNVCNANLLGPMFYEGSLGINAEFPPVA
jgi:hypothetical protein